MKKEKEVRKRERKGRWKVRGKKEKEGKRGQVFIFFHRELLIVIIYKIIILQEQTGDGLL